MIISASRRTDIPAFYSTWFFRRLREGFVLVPNPFNAKQISRVSLLPGEVDCFVFWTKNAAPMMTYIEELKRLPCYFQFTVTPYGRDAEPFLPSKEEIIRTFQELSRYLGRHRVVWRYDPILLTPAYTLDWHIRQFRTMASRLAHYTDCCVISFMDMYKNTEQNTRRLSIRELTVPEMRELSAAMASTCRACGLTLQTCAEEIYLQDLGISHGACIDRRRIEQVTGKFLAIPKDTNQRGACGCIQSVDMGQYNTCRHLCCYCYANSNARQVRARWDTHDDAALLLTGQIPPDAMITRRETLHQKVPDTSFEETSLFNE